MIPTIHSVQLDIMDAQQQEMQMMINDVPITRLFDQKAFQELTSFTKQVVHPETIHWLPVGFLCLWFGIYLMASLLHSLILPFALGKSKWKSCAPHQRTMVIYIISVIVTTIALILQLIATPIFLLRFSKNSVDCVRGAACLIAVLYFFELTYREKMRVQMLAHHIITVFISSFILIMLDRTNDPSFILTGNLWLFQATAEQTTFVALFMYRIFSPAKIVRTLLYISSLQSLIVKMASTVGTIYVFARWQINAHYKDINPNIDGKLQITWQVLFWIAIVGLSITQFWGSWVLYIMGKTIEKRYEKKNQSDKMTKKNIVSSPSLDKFDFERGLKNTNLSANTSSDEERKDSVEGDEVFYELPSIANHRNAIDQTPTSDRSAMSLVL